MSLLAKLTVKPLLYTLGVLLLVIAGLVATLHFMQAQVEVANAASASAIARRDAMATERDAWKGDAGRALLANADYQGVVKLLQTELTRCQGEARAMEESNHKAVAAARAEADDADRALKQFTRKFQMESRKPTCARALESMEASCPALSDY
jgi:hypothetical protein